MKDDIIKELREHQDVAGKLEGLAAGIGRAAELVLAACRSGNKVLLVGNGGSAADAQHIATELVGRFSRDRRPLAALALTTDTSVLTALANDYGFEATFARQIEALGRRGDVLIALSTSGSSPNVVNAVQKARQMGITVIAFTGETGQALGKLADVTLAVPSRRTPRIQEAHITIGHIICAMVEKGIDGEAGGLSR